MQEMLGPLIEKERQKQEKDNRSDKIQYSPTELARIEKINAMKNKLAGKGNELDQFAVNKTASEEVTRIEDPVNLVKPSPVRLPLSAQQQKEDKIAVMKLKMNDKPKPGEERQILFIKWAGERKPIFVNKTWTIGKAINTAKESLKIKSFYKVGSDQKLEASDNVRDVLKDEDTIVLN